MSYGSLRNLNTFKSGVVRISGLALLVRHILKTIRAIAGLHANLKIEEFYFVGHPYVTNPSVCMHKEWLQLKAMMVIYLQLAALT